MKQARRRVRVAAVDAGSNATRLLLGEWQGGGVFVEEMFLRVPLRLGGDGGGVWSAQKIRKLAMILRAYGIILKAAAPDDWQAVATAALRECDNRREVLASVKRISGIRLRVLSGREEAELAGRFVASSFAGRLVLNMDTGGGSTDCAVVKKGKVLAAESFDIGTARRTGARAKAQMQLWLRQQAAMHKNIVLTGSGGSVRALEKMCGGTIDKKALTKLLPVVAKMTPSLRARRFGLAADRAASVVPAMRIYLCALESTNAPRLHAIAGGLCQAVITDIAARF
ncbi:MAG: hypothetical protein ACR2P4_08645 [Gammaproteobacteria bacterium]